MNADDDDVARSPWWYSGDDEVEPPVASSGMDWSTLMMGAAKMVDWATERVMAPHAEHEDPAEHPQCVVCRTIVLVGEPGGLGTPQGSPSTQGDFDVDHIDFLTAAHGPGVIRWIPILDQPPAS